MPNRRQALMAVLAAPAALHLNGSAAQLAAWPRQPVKLVVTFPPGGASDIVARLLAPVLSEEFGQPFTIDNRPGAGSTIGAAAVANSHADGYTLLMSNSAPLSISPYLLAKSPYDPVKSFKHIAYVGAVPTTFVVHPSVPARSLAELVTWLKAQPNPVAFGSGGLASVGQIVGEQFAKLTGVKLLHVPYKGAGPMRTDLLGGQIQLAVDALPQNLPLAHSGQLRLLAVTSPVRALQAPDVPSVVELGYPDLVAENYVGLSGPAALDDGIAGRLNAAVARALARADLRDKLTQQGFVVGGKSRAEFSAFVQAQARNWAPLVKATGATL